jgi:HAE1 family hydrophobic/amphiphilic exporter-1
MVGMIATGRSWNAVSLDLALNGRLLAFTVAVAVLTVMIIYLFLNSWRSTVITGLTLPVSIISAFFIMWVFDFTVNTMTLLALSLAIGLLIDDAIVVRENIVRHLEMGKSHDLAAKEGTSEIGLAVTATSFAVIAVFIPVAFMGGIIGKIFFQFGVTVAFAVLVSLFVSFTLDPMLSSKWADPEVEHSANDGGEHQAEQRRKANFIRRGAFAFNDWFERTADATCWLGWALSHRFTVMVAPRPSSSASYSPAPRLHLDAGHQQRRVLRQFPHPAGSTLDYGGEGTRDRHLPSAARDHYTYLSVGGGFAARRIRATCSCPQAGPGGRFSTCRPICAASCADPGRSSADHGQSSIFGGRRQPIQIFMQGPEVSRLKIVADRASRPSGRCRVAEPAPARKATP